MSRGGLSKARLRRMHDVMTGHVERGGVPGLITLVSRRGEVHVDTIGMKAAGGPEAIRNGPIRRDTIFRISSMTKPITAAATMILVEECKLRLDEPVDRLLPELADRKGLDLAGRRSTRQWSQAPNPKPEGDITMRFMVLVKADKNTEAGILPDEKLLAEMGKYNEELAKAGVLLAAEGLHPSSKGARVKFSGGKRTVIDGPFTEAKELVAGFWLIQVKSKEEAIEWVKRCPNPTGTEAEIEIRQVFEASDFGPALTPELREAEERLRAQVAAKR